MNIKLKSISVINFFLNSQISAVVRVWHKQPVIEIPITIGTESIIGSNNSNLTSVIIHQSIAATSSRNDGADIPLLSKVPQSAYRKLELGKYQIYFEYNEKM